MAAIQSLMVQLEDGDDGEPHVYAIVDMQQQSENLALKLSKENEAELIKILWGVL